VDVKNYFPKIGYYLIIAVVIIFALIVIKINLLQNRIFSEGKKSSFFKPFTIFWAFKKSSKFF
jgi:hypothetical protein